MPSDGAYLSGVGCTAVVPFGTAFFVEVAPWGGEHRLRNRRSRVSVVVQSASAGRGRATAAALAASAGLTQFWTAEWEHRPGTGSTREYQPEMANLRDGPYLVPWVLA